MCNRSRFSGRGVCEYCSSDMTLVIPPLTGNTVPDASIVTSVRVFLSHNLRLYQWKTLSKWIPRLPECKLFLLTNFLSKQAIWACKVFFCVNLVINLVYNH